jgi:uncharacterized membrane protein
MFGITPVHLHLLINHIPVIGSIASVLLLIYAFLRNNSELKRVALLAFVLTAISAYATDSTGDGAERVAKHIPGISRQAIETHSDAGDTAMDVSIVAGVLALAGLVLAAMQKGGEQTIAEYVRHHKEPNKWILIATLVVGLVSIYYVSVAAYEGGLIRHPEIKPGYQPPAATSPANSADTAVPASNDKDAD